MKLLVLVITVFFTMPAFAQDNKSTVAEPPVIKPASCEHWENSAGQCEWRCSGKTVVQYDCVVVTKRKPRRSK